MSNLYEKAGVINIPSAYKEGILPSVKPSDGSADLNFTRGSAATRINAEGLIESVDGLGSELITNGNFATDSDWNKGAGWTIENGKASCNGGGGDLESDVYFDVEGKSFIFSFEIKNYTTGGINSTVRGTGGREFTNINSNGVYTINVPHSNDDSAVITFSVDNGFVGSVTNVSVKEVIDVTNIPRINYENGVGSLLLEPQSTNLIEYSSDFSDRSWNKQSGTTLTYNTTETLSPDGTYNATKITSDGISGIFKSSIMISGVVARSVYLKSVSGTTTATLADPHISSSRTHMTITNEWQRFELVYDNEHLDNKQGLWVNKITSEGLYMWGAQLEEGQVTSYIPTNGSTQTRLAETASKSGLENQINSEQGVFYFNSKILTENPDFNLGIIIGGDSINYIKLYYATTGYIIFRTVCDGVSNFLSINIGTITTVYREIACVWAANRLEIWIDGVKRRSATNFPSYPPNTLNFLDLDSFKGNIKSLEVYKTALSDKELEILTTL